MWFVFQVSKEMKNFYDSVYDQAITESNADPSKKTAVGEVLKVFHETLQCCGKGFGTAVFSVITKLSGSQDICSTNWLTVVSDVAPISNSFVLSVKKQ
ncbi:hypothetical protein ILYODFUR_039150, partial [Ilyodon furcidens]